MKQRWFDAWPGVCTAVSRNSVASIWSPSRELPVDVEPVAVGEREHLRAGPLLQAGDAGRVVGVGVRGEDPADAVAAAAGDDVEVPVVGRPGSITAISSMPTRYVFVPGPVMWPGFGARIRRTSGLSGAGDPGGQRAPRRVLDVRVGHLMRGTAPPAGAERRLPIAGRLAGARSPGMRLLRSLIRSGRPRRA